MLDLQHLQKSENIGLLAIDLKASKSPFERTVDNRVGIVRETF